MEIQKVVYGLPQAVKIPNNKLKLHLYKFCYEPASITSVFWWHQTHPQQFPIVVDDSGVKYERQADITNILNSLKNICKISEDWGGKLCCELSLEWDY